MKIFPFLVLILSVACSDKPNFSGDLVLGKEVIDSLKQQEVKSYSLELDSGYMLSGYVDQITVDVIVELRDEADAVVMSFDEPARGPENFNFEINKTGAYTLNILPFQEEKGKYAVLIQKWAQQANTPPGKVDQLMSNVSGEVPGAVVGVMKGGELIFSKAYGKANLTHDIDFALDMPTNIGSVTKQFTAMAILLLEKDGKVSLEDDVRKHVPELPDLGPEVKIKHLLNHTNGYREVYNLMPIAGWYGEDRLLRSEIINVLQRQTALQAAPGELYNYNNSAYILAAEIVERISGTNFPDFLRERIFQPLDMSNSYIRGNASKIIPRSTQGYTYGTNGYEESRDLDASYGAGGIYTTIPDLVKWLNNFESAIVGGPEVIEKLTTVDTLNNGTVMEYALGLGISSYRGLKTIAHGGADIAHRAMVVYMPEVKGGVITLSNNAGFNGEHAYRVIDAFFDEYLESEDTKTDTLQSEEIPDIELQKYEGKFRANAIGMTIEYRVESGILTASPTGQSTLKLEVIGEHEFKYVGVDASVIFKENSSGAFDVAIHSQGGAELEFIRLSDFDHRKVNLEEYTGKYFSEELETFYTLIVKDSSLVAEHRNMEDIDLSASAIDNFSGSAFFMAELSFTRNDQGEVTGMIVSNSRTKGILFERQ